MQHPKLLPVIEYKSMIRIYEYVMKCMAHLSLKAEGIQLAWKFSYIA
jgi:hypothetical protein